MESTIVAGNCITCGASPQFHLQNPFGVRKVNYMDGSLGYFGWNNVPVGEPVDECYHFTFPDGNKYDQERLFKLMINNT